MDEDREELSRETGGGKRCILLLQGIILVSCLWVCFSGRGERHAGTASQLTVAVVNVSQILGELLPKPFAESNGNVHC